MNYNDADANYVRGIIHEFYHGTHSGDQHSAVISLF